ncbi:MAG: flavocytochrome c [Lachnospiraceae bacterium]|nr:flavocytochrome c [Lachnospiraceae bacterium]
MEALSQEIAEEEIDYVTEADVVVVGAGAAGMTAALTAAQEGASVILLEKSNKVGGNTAPAQSGINAAESALQQEAEVDFTVDDFVEMQTNDLVVPELVQTLAENSGETIDWLVENGAELTVNEDKTYQLVAADSSKLTSTELLETVEEGIIDAGVDLYYNMDVTTLIQDDDGAVIGVVAEKEDGSEISFYGTAVVLATGGYGQDYERVISYRPDYENCWTDEVAPTTGEGIDMAVAVGAATKDLDQMMLFSQVVIGYGMLNSAYGPGGRTIDGIYVNENAQRFMAEAMGSDSTADILAQPDGIVTVIFNEEAKEGANIDGLISSGVLYSADSPEELAEQLGMDPETLTATIDRWNEMVDNGVDEDFGRETNLNKLEGTLYAYKFMAGVHYCMGGVLIDETAAVLNTDGEAIPGLFAAGEVTGGVHGDTRVDGSAVADSFTFGHIAGATAASYALTEQQ